MIDPYTQIVGVMREQGTAANGPGIQLATMTGPNSCSIGDLPLAGEDLYIPDRLLKPVCTAVSVPDSHQDKSAYSAPLAAGDIVVVYQLSATRYVILDRVVSGG